MILTAIITVAMSISVGTASQYAPGVMEHVVEVRQAGRTSHTLPAELPEVDGYVAVPECDHIGDLIWLRPEGSSAWETFLIVDCAGSQEAFGWMKDNNILVEVDWPTVVRWGGRCNRGIRIEAIHEDPRDVDTWRLDDRQR